jgi:hypothetical protein
VDHGFSKELRQLYYDNPSLIVGKVVKLEAQELSQNANEDSYALRFPVFIEIRDDKTVEEVLGKSLEDLVLLEINI